MNLFIVNSYSKTIEIFENVKLFSLSSKKIKKDQKRLKMIKKDQKRSKKIKKDQNMFKNGEKITISDLEKFKAVKFFIC